MTLHPETSPADIAVIGMACRLPGAQDPDQYWRNLREGVESIRFYSDEQLRERGVSEALLSNPRYVPASGAFDDGEGFDAAFFGYTVRDAEIMDPQHRHFLEVAYHALEDAGYDPGRYPGMIGVYGGCTMNTYLPMNIIPNSGVLDVVGDLQVMLGGDKEYLPARVSYKLDLTGPSIAVQSACSTSLTAIHIASQAILSGECDMALAGGSSVRMPYGTGYLHNPGGTSSPDGHCRAFDVDSGGSVVGNGAGVVLLKHLQDALADGDHIYAVIKGTSINNDGSQKVSFTAPSVQGQARATVGALLAAQVSADDIGYVEAHGTGTPMGDPIEVAALTAAYRESGATRDGFCALGSVKPNIGHLDAAAGVVGFIKATQVLRHAAVPPTLHFTAPNPQLRLESSPFFVNNELIDWPGPSPRRAGVNSLGMGGSNAHVILEEAPEQTGGDPAEPGQLLMLSAHTATALETMSADLARWLTEHPGANLADVAYTLQVGRRPLRFRRTVAVRDAEDARLALGTTGSSRVATHRCDPAATGVAFLFPGQGSQYPGMAAALYAASSAYRGALDECLAGVELGDELRHLLLTADRTDQQALDRLRQTDVLQPALFAVEYAAAVMLRDLGLEPTAMLGHSIGEYVAATLAGVFALPDALRVVSARGQLMAELPPGAMVAVTSSAEEVVARLVPGVELAAVNTPEGVTLTGEPEAVARVVAQLEADGVVTRSLPVSGAFHSAMLDPLLDRYRAVLAGIELHAPALPFVSNVTGDFITDEEATDPEYWIRHLRGTVRFAAGCATLAGRGALVLVEAGPGSALLGMARRTPGAEWSSLVALQPGAGDRADARRTWLGAVGRLWAAGLGVDFFRLWEGSSRKRVALPVYPFEHRRYWMDPVPGRLAQAVAASAPATAPVPPPVAAPVAAPAPVPAPAGGAAAPERSFGHVRPDLATAFAAPTTEIESSITLAMAELLSIDRVGVNDNFFDFNADSLMAMQLISRLRDLHQIDLPLTRLFETPTAAGLAALVEELSRDTARPAQPAAALPPVRPAPADPVAADPLPGQPGLVSDADVEDLLNSVRPDELERLLNEIEKR